MLIRREISVRPKAHSRVSAGQEEALAGHRLLGSLTLDLQPPGRQKGCHAYSATPPPRPPAVPRTKGISEGATLSLRRGCLLGPRGARFKFSRSNGLSLQVLDWGTWATRPADSSGFSAD